VFVAGEETGRAAGAAAAVAHPVVKQREREGNTETERMRVE
jgi:hypothetical protein